MSSDGNDIEEVVMKPGHEEQDRTANRAASADAALDRISVALRGLEFGTVTAVV
jgi:hypothetical protein